MARVLVVDDDPSIGQLLTASLGADGHQVEVLTEGLQTHAHVSANAIDVVLLDILMPDVNGLDVLGQLKDDPATSSVPVIILTGQDDEQGEAHGMESGAEFYFTKPMNMGLLSATISMLVTEEDAAEITMLPSPAATIDPGPSEPATSAYDGGADLDLIRQQLSDL